MKETCQQISSPHATAPMDGDPRSKTHLTHNQNQILHATIPPTLTPRPATGKLDPILRDPGTATKGGTGIVAAKEKD
jgi:hypothetical protein